MKTLTQKEAKKLFNEIIDTHEENRYSYFRGGYGGHYWLRDKDFDDDYSFKVVSSKGSVSFEINQSLQITRNHSYYSLMVYVNDVKKDIRALKAFISDSKKFLAKFSK